MLVASFTYEDAGKFIATVDEPAAAVIEEVPKEEEEETEDE